MLGRSSIGIATEADVANAVSNINVGNAIETKIYKGNYSLLSTNDPEVTVPLFEVPVVLSIGTFMVEYDFTCDITNAAQIIQTFSIALTSISDTLSIDSLVGIKSYVTQTNLDVAELKSGTSFGNPLTTGFTDGTETAHKTLHGRFVSLMYTSDGGTITPRLIITNTNSTTASASGIMKITKLGTDDLTSINPIQI